MINYNLYDCGVNRTIVFKLIDQVRRRTQVSRWRARRFIEPKIDWYNSCCPHELYSAKPLVLQL